MPRPTKCGNGLAGGPSVPPLRKSRAIPGGHPHPLPSGAPSPWKGGGWRAAQVCRPYERTGQFSVVTLIRPLRGHLPPERGNACGRPHGAAPTKGPGNSRWLPSSVPFGATFPLKGGMLAGGHTGSPLRRILRRERWIGQVRRGSGTAPALIFHPPRAQWPGGNLDTHSDFARR